MRGLQKIFFVICVVVISLILLKLFVMDLDALHPNEILSTNNKRPHAYISAIIGGQLGNNIWEYMSVLAFMHLYENEVNFTAHIPVELKTKMKLLFERNSIQEVSRIPVSCLKKRSYVLLANETFNPDKFLKKQKCSLTLTKFTARYDEVLEYGFDKIRKELRFHEKYIKYSNEVFNQIKTTHNMSSENVTFVGMHYRGTDYVSYLKKFYGKSPNVKPDSTFYLKAMDYFKKIYKTVVFILITIDMPWLEKNLPLLLQENNNLVVNPNDNDLVKDLVLLSHCNHSIINYGTFGTTVALFSGGTTLVYDLGLPLDKRGATVAMGIAEILPNWHVLK